MQIVKDILTGNRLSLSRLLTRVENIDPQGLAALDAMFPHTGKAHIIGVTGAPGTGKSSLVNHLALAFRHPGDGQEPKQVAVIAVDPSSPFTGGALLGDRVRMRDLAGDPGIFIRSMASRGMLGGLAHTTSALAQILDAAGFEVVIIETVGVGQSEVDIARLAHTTLVVEAPGMGDDIQAGKAGILEIADIIVVNKADRPGVENTARMLRSMLDMVSPEYSLKAGHRTEGSSSKKEDDELSWSPPVISTVALDGKGVDLLVEEILKHKAYLECSGEWARRERLRLQAELDDLLKISLVNSWHDQLPAGKYEAMLELLCNREVSMYQAVSILLHTSKTGIPVPDIEKIIQTKD